MPTQTKKPTIHLHKVEVDVATKHDIELVKQDIKLVRQEIDGVKTELSYLKWILSGFLIGFGIMAGLMTYLHNDTKTNMQAIKTDMQADMQAMEKRNTEQMQAIKTDMQADMQAMEKRNIERHNELKRLIQKGK